MHVLDLGSLKSVCSYVLKNLTVGEHKCLIAKQIDFTINTQCPSLLLFTEPLLVFSGSEERVEGEILFRLVAVL